MRRYFFALMTFALCLQANALPFSEPTDTTQQRSFLSPQQEPIQSSADPQKSSPSPSMPEEQPMPTYGATFAKMILTLAGLIALVILSVWLLKKLMQGKMGSFGKKHIQIIERRPLSPKTMLYVIETSGKQLLVAESQLEIKTLASEDIVKCDS